MYWFNDAEPARQPGKWLRTLRFAFARHVGNCFRYGFLLYSLGVALWPSSGLERGREDLNDTRCAVEFFDALFG